MPEDVSENLVLTFIERAEPEIKCTRPAVGDLIKTDKEGKVTIVEVKCITSTGPSSFGPVEKWDELYLFIVNPDDTYKLIRIKLSNTDDAFRNVMISKGETFGKQAGDNRRPRIVYSDLLEQLSDDAYEEVSKGSLKEFIDNERLEIANSLWKLEN